jgi:hypothetical protein
MRSSGMDIARSVRLRIGRWTFGNVVHLEGSVG